MIPKPSRLRVAAALSAYAFCSVVSSSVASTSISAFVSEEARFFAGFAPPLGVDPAGFAGFAPTVGGRPRRLRKDVGLGRGLLLLRRWPLCEPPLPLRFLLLRCCIFRFLQVLGAERLPGLGHMVLLQSRRSSFGCQAFGTDQVGRSHILRPAEVRRTLGNRARPSPWAL